MNDDLERTGQAAEAWLAGDGADVWRWDAELGRQRSAGDPGIWLTVRVNPAPITQGCALCAVPDRYGYGPMFFRGDTWEPVCDRCGARYTPALVPLLAAARGAWAQQQP